ncbi:MAG: NIL domain-containing protein [Verrucomicrobiales bacterium]|jgi:ABC-type methionine transport system ATPase subunit|nr:NIL domain-containing protein [Verrucomicrobiales bacterium]
MAKCKGRYWLNFTGPQATEPLIYLMGKKFDVMFNIRQATISDTMGLMGVEFEADREVLQAAIAWLEAQGVKVGPVELNTIEG